jgi:hypothetical protein
VRPVHRVYLALDATGTPIGADRDDAVEQWCPSCVATYPHAPVNPAP